MAWRAVGGAVAILAASPSYAQIPFNLDTKASEAKQAEIGGTFALDIIQLRATGPGTPLRFGNVVQGSEQVQLENRVLTPVQDYALDLAAGVVYLKCTQKAGQTLTVSYRYKAGPAPTGSGLSGGAVPYKYTLVPGGLNLLMGLGLTERTSDGRVLSGNAFGWNNSFNIGQGTLGGLYLYNQRTESANQAGLSMDSTAKPGDAVGGAGASQLVLQHYGSKLMGGEISADYQDVSNNFTNFSAVAGSGYDSATVARLQSEKGLTRFGFGLKDLKFGSLALSNSYRKIGDGAGALEWRSYGLQQGGLKLNYSSQKVDQSFTRFKDISEADRDQLMREAGMARTNLAGEFAQKAGTISYKTQAIEDSHSGLKISRSEYGLDTSKIKFNLGQQSVDAGFGRIGSLMGAEQATYGREVGLNRQWMGLQASLLKGEAPISFSSLSLSGPNGKFQSQDISAKSKSWSLTHASRTSDASFTSIGALSDAEQDANIRDIAKMYGPGLQTQPGDRGAFTLGNGIGRSFTSLSAQPFKGWDLKLSQLELKGQNGRGKVDEIALNAAKFSASYRRQDLGEKFSEQSRLMGFEQQRLGSIAGLDRTDFGFNMNLGRGKAFSASTLTANTAVGGARRASVAYTDRTIDVSVNTREVDPGFTSVNALVDPEKDLLASLRGFKQRDARVKWQLLPNLKLDAFMADSSGMENQVDGGVRNVILDWAPDKRTSLNYTRLEQKSQDPLSTLFAQAVERISVNRDLGRIGRLGLVDERYSNSGTTNTSPDHHRQALTFDTKLNSKTALHSEQTRMNFGNGDKEDINSNTVSTTLTKNAGVSVTETAIDRNGLDRDEKKRNYGFWLDIGNGLRVSYGYVRNLTGETAGALTSSFSVGQNTQTVNPDQVNTVQQGTVGGLTLGGGYGVNSWDADKRTQAFSNFGLATAKPMRFGILKDVQMKFGMDTASDYGNWLRENRVANFSGKIGSNILGYDYVSQMQAGGDRAIDRVFRLQTDQSDKRPLRASIFYKVRTLPSDKQFMIRDYNVTVKPFKNIELTNQLQTNPEIARGDVILGSLPQAARSNKWQLNWLKSENLTVGASWQELINEQANANSTTGGLNLKLFGKSGSPLTLFYGIEEVGGNVVRRLTHRYSLQFDQRPGKNQILSIFAGNISYEHSFAENAQRNNWTLRLNYQLKF